MWFNIIISSQFMTNSNNNHEFLLWFRHILKNENVKIPM